jgi:hypothetical protein
VFQTKGIAYIYWSIDYTPKIEFVSLFPIKRIAYIYWSIDYTPKVEIV